MRPLEGLRAWADRTPNATALTDGTTQLTFHELYAYVLGAAVAGRAALRGAPDGAFLPVIVDRSVRSAAAITACYFGRVPFFPIDAGASPEFKLHLEHLAGHPGCYVDATTSGACIPGAVAIELAADPTSVVLDTEEGPSDDEPGLVILSSGTTGVPKGVVIPWRSQEARWRRRDASHAVMGDDRRQPLVVPLDSSFGVQELAVVASGFCQYLVDVTRMRPSEFLATMADFAPTTMAIPSQLGRLLAQLSPQMIVPLPSVRRLHLASEGFSYDYMHGLSAIFSPDTTIVHSLASTEGGVEMVAEFALSKALPAGPVHVGRVLNPDCVRLEPVEQSGVGEVHVSGAIASEYLGNPELTAERFYDDESGRRWWRSRDLVSLDADGQYLHVGRMDDLVKVGSRLVAPSDVSAALLELDGITGAVTVPVVTDATTRLVAHIDVEPGSTITLGEIHRFLLTRLPTHALPSAVMRHARLPINDRGKIDRVALRNGPYESW